MEASCGPTNALNKLSQYSQRDNSLQNDVLRQPQHNPTAQFKGGQLVDERLNQDFNQFNQTGGSSNFASQFMNSHAPQFQNRNVQAVPQNRAQQFQHQYQPQTGNSNWVLDFSSMSIGDSQRANWNQQFNQNMSQQMQSQTQNQNQMNGVQQRQFMAQRTNGEAFQLNMRTNLSTTMNINNRPMNMNTLSPGFKTEHQEMHEAAFFDNQFNELEKELQETTEQQEIFDDSEKEKFAETARRVKSSMLRGGSLQLEETSQKFQNSNFLKLMNSIGNRQVELEGDKLVEKEGQISQINVEPQDTRVSMVPMADGKEIDYHKPLHPFPDVTEEKRQNLREEHINHLPDPLAHLKEGDLADFKSPLEAAKIVSGNQVKTSDWMDDDLWLDQTGPASQRSQIMTDEWQEMFDDYRHDDH